MARLPRLRLAALPGGAERGAGLALPGRLHELREGAAMIGVVLAPVVEALRDIRDDWNRLCLWWLEATGPDKTLGRLVAWLGRKLP